MSGVDLTMDDTAERRDLRKMKQLGASLGEFVGTNFLVPDVVVSKLHSVRVPERLGAWVAHPANAERITAEAAAVLRGAVAVLRDEDVQQVIDATIVRKLVDQQW